MPYVHKASSVTVVVAGDPIPGDAQEILRNELKAHSAVYASGSSPRVSSKWMTESN